MLGLFTRKIPYEHIMRVALLFCGRIHGYKECYESFIKHVVTPLGIEYDSFLAHNVENSCADIDTFIHLYSVKKCTNEPPDVGSFHNFPRNLGATWGLNGFKMFYFWKKAYELMETYSKSNTIQYDVVMYMRADQLFRSDVKLPPIEKNSVYIPEGNDWLSGLNDQMAIGQPDTMKKFMDVYSNIRRIYSDTGIEFHPELYVRLSTRLQNIRVIRFNLDYSLDRQWKK